MFRRFQHMLSRTKMAQARVMNDKALIQQLRGKDARRLHCESHILNGEDAEFLKKLKKNPFVVDHTDPGRQLPDIQKNSKLDTEVTDEETLLLIQTFLEEKGIDHTPGNLQRLSTLGRVLDAAMRVREQDEIPNDPYGESQNSSLGLKIGHSAKCNPGVSISVLENTKDVVTSRFQGRPITSDAIRQQSHDMDKSLLGSADAISSKSLSNVEKAKIDVSADEIDSESTSTSTNSINVETSKRKTQNNFVILNDKENARSSPVNSITENNIAALKTLIDKMKFDSNSHNTETENQKARSLLDRLCPTKITPRKRMTSIFDEVKPPDVHGMRLQEAKKVDHSVQVKEFIKDLSNFGHGVPDFDYYASKMQLDAAQQVKPDLPSQMPSTPDNIYRKHTGDPTISAITLPKLRPIKPDDIDKNDASYIYEFWTNDLFDPIIVAVLVLTLKRSKNKNCIDQIVLILVRYSIILPLA